MKTRFLSTLLCLFLVLTFPPMVVSAEENFSQHDTGKVEVITEKLNIRSAPSSSGKIIDIVTKGTILTVTDAYSKSISTWPRYHQIDYNGVNAYVMSEKTSKSEDKYVKVVDITSHYDKNAAALANAPGSSKDSPFIFDGGSGTYSDPYLISTADQLNAMRKGLDKHYKLTNDIDLSMWGNWVPIGGNAAYGGFGSAANVACKDVQIFHGSLDGNGHVISGMTIKILSDDVFLNEGLNIRNYGLFAGVGATADDYSKGINKYKGPVYTKDPYNDTTTCNIRNLGIVNYTIDISYQSMTKPIEVYAGAIAGKAGPCGIYNCCTSGGQIKFDLNYIGNASKMSIVQRARIGGLVGKANDIDIRSCYNTSPITLTSNYVDYQELLGGGLCGATSYCWISNSFNTGDVTFPLATPDKAWTSSRTAGIAPFDSIPEIPGIYNMSKSDATYIFNCYNTGNITAETASGILVYTASDIYIENCYNTGKITGNPVNHDYATTRTSNIINTMSAVTKYGSKYIINS